MATMITGPDPAAAVWPIPLLPIRAGSRPTGYSVVGGAETGVLGDGSDATYNQQQKADNYFRYNVGSVALPFGARVTSVTPSVRARMVATNVRNDWVVFQGDHSGVKFAAADHLPAAHYPISSSQQLRTYSGPAVSTLANKQLITQADLERGLYVAFGLNTVYGSSAANPAVRVAEAKLQLTYDMAPTAVLTGPTPGSTVADTASPLITWDYADDFQPQAAYSLTLTSSAGLLVYSSGKVSSADTSHHVTTNLPNDTYTVSLRVYQAWSGPGGAFPSLAAVMSTFTVSVLKLGLPTIAAAVTVEQVKITVTPNVNLLNLDDSTFDRGVVALQGGNTNCTVAAAAAPVLNGTGSVKVTVTAAGTAVLTSRPGAVPCKPLDQHNALVYLDPLALTGRSAQLKLVYRNAAGAVLSTVNGTVTALPANTWTPLAIVNATAPLLAASVEWSATLTGTAAGDGIYLDNAAIWHGGAGSRTNLVTNPRLNNGTTGYTAAGNTAPTIAVVSGDSMAGNNALKVTATGANTFFAGVAQAAIATVVGATYTASCYVKQPTAGGPVSSVYGVVNGLPQFTTTNTVTDDDVWVRATVTFQAAAASTSVTWAFGGADVVAGQYFLLSGFLFEQAGTALAYFDGSSPAASWTGTADQSTSTTTASFPAWSRGGFYEATPNVLSYDDSTLEGDGWTWTATPDANTTVAVSAAQATHGARSLVVSRTTASAAVNYAAATAGAAARYPCTPGETLRGYFAARAASTGRTVQLNLDFYDASGATVAMPAGQANTVATTADVTTGWVTATGSIQVPALAVGYRVSVLAVVAAGTAFPVGELHHFDAISVYRSAYDLGFTPGYLPNTDEAPVVVVEYSDLSGPWIELGRAASAQSDTSEVFYDYTARSGIGRRYRAYLTETENDVDLTSDYSSTATATVALRGAWIATAVDPVGTSHQFFFDGAGRTHQLGAQPDLYPIEGRDYPFAEFGTGYDQQLQVTLQLPADVDRFALLTLAKAKSEVLFRDQRGRSIRGVMGTVDFSDEVWGQTAKFTVQATGSQP